MICELKVRPQMHDGFAMQVAGLSVHLRKGLARLGQTRVAGYEMTTVGGFCPHADFLPTAIPSLVALDKLWVVPVRGELERLRD